MTDVVTVIVGDSTEECALRCEMNLDRTDDD